MKPSNLATIGLVGLGVALLASDNEQSIPQQTPEPEPYDPRFDPTKPPYEVRRPAGWKGYGGTVSDEMRAAASRAVNTSTTKLGQLIPGGTIAEAGKGWAVFLEWHFHPRGQGFSAEGWHKGATILVER